MEFNGNQTELENSPEHFSIRAYVSHVDKIDRKIQPTPVSVSAFHLWQRPEKKITADHVETASESHEEPCSDIVQTGGSDSNGGSVIDPVDTGSVSSESNVSDTLGPATIGDSIVGAVETGFGSDGETTTNPVLNGSSELHTGSGSNGESETEYVERESGKKPLGIDLNLSPTHQEINNERRSEIKAAKKLDFAVSLDDQRLSSLKMKGIMPEYKERDSFLMNQQGETQAHLRRTESSLLNSQWAVSGEIPRDNAEKQIVSDIGNKNCAPETTTKGVKGSNRLITEEAIRRYEILRSIGESRLGKPDKFKSTPVQSLTYVPQVHYKPPRASNGLQFPSSSSTQTQFSGMNHGYQNSLYQDNQEALLSGTTTPGLFAQNHPIPHIQENPSNASQLRFGSSSRACGDPNSLFMQNLAKSEARIRYLTASSGPGDLNPRHSQTATWQNPPRPGWSPMIPNCFPYGMRNPNIANRNSQYLFPNGSAQLQANPRDNNNKNLDIGTSQRLYPSEAHSTNTSRIGEMQLNLQAIGPNNLYRTGNMTELLRSVHAGACPSQPINQDNAAQNSFPPSVAHLNNHDMSTFMHPPAAMHLARNGGNPDGAAAPPVPGSENGLCHLNLNPAEFVFPEYLGDPPGKKARRDR